MSKITFKEFQYNTQVENCLLEQMQNIGINTSDTSSHQWGEKQTVTEVLSQLNHLIELADSRVI